MSFPAQNALGNARSNRFAVWNQGRSTQVSTNDNHASRRIFDGCARIGAEAPARKVELAAPVFTIGSCFAREIEASLTRAGGNVVSMDYTRMERDEFRDASGLVRNGFFHRFTPRAIWHEFKIAFDEMPGWDPAGSLLFPRGDGLVDFNYWEIAGFDESLAAHISRRAVASELVRRVARSELIILTLGLVESWVHLPTGFHCNRIDPRILKRSPDEFALRMIDYSDTIWCLNDIYDLIERHHQTGDFQLVVTVSPVPLNLTFSEKDVIVANENSKAILRAAAGAFCTGNPKVRYFPSYEMVRFSDPALAWRADRSHVQSRMVDHVVGCFMETYFR